MNCEFEIHPDPFWAAAKLAGGDGYDRMDTAMAHGWFPIPCWGKDGWDLGDWPYVIVYARDTQDRFEVAQDCEGDVTCWTFNTAQERVRFLDRLAVYWWRSSGAAWFHAISPDELPRILGPFRPTPDAAGAR
jgi:hypothetical protein